MTTTDYTRGEIALDATEPDPDTGTRRLDLWRDDPEGVGAGDYAVGWAYSSRYVSEDGTGCAEITVYAYCVTIRTEAGAAVQDSPDGPVRPDDSAEITYEHPDYRDYATEEEAQASCDAQGMRDYSWCLYLHDEVQR